MREEREKGNKERSGRRGGGRAQEEEKGGERRGSPTPHFPIRNWNQRKG